MTWRPNTESSKLLFSAQRVLNDYDYDITLKQLFYLLVDLGEITMTSNSYRKLSTLMLNCRKYGRIRPDLFVEEQDFDLKPANLEDFVDSYRINRLSMQDDYVEIWVDKASFAQFVRKTVKPYDVQVFTSEGFSPYSFTYSAYLRLTNAAKMGKIPRILYFSDFEPTSLVIFESILSELASLLNMTTREVSTFVFRVMVLPEHIVHYQLPYEILESSKSTELFEERYSSTLKSVGLPGVLKAEVESLNPSVAKGLILNAVFAILDYGKISFAQEIESAERMALRQLFKKQGLF